MSKILKRAVILIILLQMMPGPAHGQGLRLQNIGMKQESSLNSVIPPPFQPWFSIETCSSILCSSDRGEISYPDADVLTSKSGFSPFFCRIEHALEQRSSIAPRFRLGTLEYVNALEGYR